MASRLFPRITIFNLILSLCFAAIPASVQAASPADFGLTSPTSATINQYQGQSEIKTNVFKFYLDPALVPNMDFAKAALPKYIEDMNTILAKNTNRRLVFNPETDIVLTNSQPFSNQAVSPLPVENFEIWAYAIQTNYSISYGGYAGLDESGAGVLAGLKWTKLYDPDKLTSNELADYWTQINNMLHELAHVFGAGIGEYYKISSIHDATGVSPLLDINVQDPNDAFWSDKPDFMADPLLRNAVQIQDLERLSNREDFLNYVKYSDLTATLISGDYRNTTPMVDLRNITVTVVTDNGAPISNANIKIWSVVGNAPYQAQLMVDTFTDSNGQASFVWGGSINPHNNYDFLRLIKVYKAGYIPSAKYVSIFDTDIVKLIGGNNLFNISMPLNAADAPPILTEGDSTNVSMSVDGAPMPFSQTLHATDVDGGTITWSTPTPALHGTALASGTGISKSIVYVPTHNYTGTDSFVVQVSDVNGGTDTITVNVTITAVAPSSFTIFLPLITR
jgi:hypothetical protein